jgi:hypothetical protein
VVSGVLLIAASAWATPAEAAGVALVIASGVVASRLFQRNLG